MNLRMNPESTQRIAKAFTFIAILLISISANAQGISMSPSRLFFNGNPGATLVQNVTITNGSSKSVTFNTRISDWYRNETGVKVYVDANTLPKSNSSWVSTPEALFTIEAGSTITVPITIMIPENASTTAVSNSMLFFSQIGQQADIPKAGVGIGLQVLFEFGLHVYNTPPANQTQDLEFTAVEDLGIVNQDSVPNRRIGVKIKNEGNIISDSTVELELTDKNSGEEIKLNPINISMLPDDEQLVYFDLPATIKGSYSGVSIIKMGGTTDMRIAEKDFEFQ
jgi:P pilus assembly chaperone PapD